MQVLAGINGTIAAESAAIYAMVYAKAQEYTLVLFHMPNAKDNREDVASSMKRLETLASAFEADAQVHSISNVSKRKLAFLSLDNVKEKLSQINHSLRHYLKLSAFMPYNLVIKHDFSEDEVESILYNIATTRTDLAVVGAKRLEGRWFCFKEAPLERLMRETSANLIALYTQEN